jgi:hypothetical protein
VYTLNSGSRPLGFAKLEAMPMADYERAVALIEQNQDEQTSLGRGHRI